MGTYTRYLLYLVGFRGLWDFVPDWSKLILGLTHPVVLLPIALGGLYLWLQKASYRASIVVVLLVSTIGAVSMWDQRSPAKKLIESTQSSSEIFGHAIEPGATVFWYADLLSPWVLLQRPSYWSDLQQAGLLFNRGTAIEAHRREVILQPFLMQAELCKIMDNLNKKTAELPNIMKALNTAKENLLYEEEQQTIIETKKPRDIAKDFILEYLTQHKNSEYKDIVASAELLEISETTLERAKDDLKRDKIIDKKK